jgi:hypothetical protein
MIQLTNTSHSLELQTSGSSTINWSCYYVDIGAASTTPGSAQGSVASATTTTIASAPGASTTRLIKNIMAVNTGTASQTLTVKKDVSGSETIILKATINKDESLLYSAERGWTRYDSAGNEIIDLAQRDIAVDFSSSYRKTGTTPEAGATWYTHAKDTPVWSPFTSSTAGRATDGRTSPDWAGCLRLYSPANTWYLNEVEFSTTFRGAYSFWDILWANGGIVVTTTTQQIMNSPITVNLPPRDNNGTSNGEGCYAGLLILTATTNASAISNSTIRYTSAANSPNKVGTFSAITGDRIAPTFVAGSVVWFKLAAGDTGVRSIQALTLNTSLGGGRVALIIARPVTGTITYQYNPFNVSTGFDFPGIKVFAGSNMHMFSIYESAINSTVSAVVKFFDV